MNKWPYTVKTYSPEEVQKYCVGDPKWQKFRRSLKGLPTTMKLDKLAEWRKGHLFIFETPTRESQVQVDNYVNALKRGGQLNMNCEVQR